MDPTRPFLISIGENVKITKGVTILTHGFDWFVLKQVYGDVLGSSGAVKIGNNVFIGMNTTVLKGISIGDNVIIGANSLVNKDIPGNCVAAGNPIKIICSLDDYYKKRKTMQLVEAENLVKAYRERWGRDPSEKELHEFFWLFSDADDQLCDLYKNMMLLGGNAEHTYKAFKENKKQYDSMRDFLDSIE